MRQQFFGDRRDYIKLTVWDGLHSSLKRSIVTYVPMLTPDRLDQGQRVRPRSGDLFRAEIREFFEEHRDDAAVRCFREWFSGKQYRPYRDEGLNSDYLQHATRHAYLSDILSRNLTDALIFIDPDTGVSARPDRRRREEELTGYLFFDELVALWSRASNSALLVYQHLQRDAHKRVSSLVQTGLKIREQIGQGDVAFLAEEDLGFLLVTEPALREQVRSGLQRLVRELGESKAQWGLIA